MLFSHAFLIATGTEATEPLVRLLESDTILGLYGVFTFFIISGFLLARSLAANPRPLTYAVNRTLRILPGFLLCVAMTAFVIGPLFSSLPLRSYVSGSGVFEFVRMSVGTLGDWTLGGLYDYEGRLASVVNGSLWSLHYEALSYVLLLVLWLTLRSHSMVAAAGVLLSSLVWTVPVFTTWLPSVAYTLPYFASGVAMSWVHARYGTRPVGAVVSVAGLIAAAAYGLDAYAFAVFGAYLVVYLGERRNIGSALAARIGDCSYGLYLYGWPAEQIVEQMTGTTSALLLFALATPLAFVLAAASYHSVERRAMKARERVDHLISRAVARAAGGRARYASRGATVGFVVAATWILTSRIRWYYFFESVGLIVLAVGVGGILAMVLSILIARRSEPSADTVSCPRGTSS